MRAGASRARPSATAASTRPPPAAIVSAACASGLSPTATAAAMPPCAQALDAPSPSGAAVITVTGRGASFSAQNNPARPPPTMTTLSVFEMRFSVWLRMLRLLVRGSISPANITVIPAKAGIHNHRRELLRDTCGWLPSEHFCLGLWVPAFAGTTAQFGAVSVLQIDHALHRSPRALGDRWIDHDLLAQKQQALKD